MSDFVKQTIARQPRSFVLQLAVAVICIAFATAARVALSVAVPEGVPYVTFFPLLVVAALYGGLRAGFLCLAGSTFVAAFFVTGSWSWFPVAVPAWTGMAVFLLSGGLIVTLCHLLATTVRDLDTAHTHEQSLVLELQHRVKNTLAVVQALATQTLTGGGSLVDAREAFIERLIALGRAHNLLSDAAWRDVNLSALVGRTLDPFMEPGRAQLTMEGEAFALPADVVVDLALCLHELATNAVKYGALSTQEGRVSVRWGRVAGAPQRAQVVWEEVGGPPVIAPTRRGYGSRLLARGVGRRLRPQVSTSYDPAGVVWRLEFDLPRS